jgi:polysaccharide export outer membrane protein
VSSPYLPDTAPPVLATSAATLRVGEKITVTYSDIPQPPMPHDQRIRDDGTITLPLIGPVVALGKSPGQLEDAIHKAYVPRFYRRITVVVDADERTFSVGGEVKISNRQHYTDRITVLRAIQAAGDFTDFADRKRIELIRSSGRKEVVDWYEAKDHPEFDLEVFPGDQIIVRKRAF